MQLDTTLLVESEEELKSPLMKVKDKSEKAGLKVNIQKMKIMSSGHITSWQIYGNIMETVSDFIFLGSKITVDGDCSHEIQRRLLLRWKAVTNLDSVLKCRDITLQRKAHIVKAMVFLCMVWKLNNKKGWASKNWCLQTVVLQKTLESPLDCKEIKPVNPKGNQPWIFIGKIDAESEAPILWPPDMKNQLIGKDPDAVKDWRQEENGMTGWDGWMASPTLWAWVWAGSRVGDG